MARILVINPNSSRRVTEGISAAVDPSRLTGGPTIDCLTLEEGPAGIETQAHVDRAGRLVRRAIQRETADAYVIACFSDPGLHAAREATDKPVVGIAEAGMLAALMLGDMVGVISILPGSIARHWRMYRAMGIGARVAGDRAIGRGIAALADEGATRGAMIATAKALVDLDGASVLVMGCAGMARFRPALEDAIGVPVVEPCQAAVGAALTLLRFNYRQRIAAPAKAAE